MKVNFGNENSRNTLPIPLKKEAQVNIYWEKNTKIHSPVHQLCQIGWDCLSYWQAVQFLLIIAGADNIPHAIETYVSQEITLQVKDQIKTF